MEICGILWKSMQFFGNLLNSRDLGCLNFIKIENIRETSICLGFVSTSVTKLGYGSLDLLEIKNSFFIYIYVFILDFLIIYHLTELCIEKDMHS